jgi:hypothetical protein
MLAHLTMGTPTAHKRLPAVMSPITNKKLTDYPVSTL